MHELKYDASMSTGNEDMDAQHRELFAIYNKLREAMMIGKGHKRMSLILGDLIDYTSRHFAAEEAVMAEMEYPDLDDHRILHKQLMEKVERFRTKQNLGLEHITKPVLQFLHYWLKDHITGTDARYGQYARSLAEARESETVSE